MKHIAILRQPFFDMVLSGEKTIESRWSMNKIAPYEKVKEGDIIYLKKTGEDISATAVAGKVMFYELTPSLAEEIRVKYGKAIGTDKFSDLETYTHKKYLTLIFLKDVKSVKAMPAPKSHGAGWLIVD